MIANVLLDGVVELDLKADLEFDIKMAAAQKIQREQIEAARIRRDAEAKKKKEEAAKKAEAEKKKE